MSVSSKSRWTIGELARTAGVSVRALRHYEDVGLLVPDRSEGGHRRYEASDLALLRQILALRELGLIRGGIRLPLSPLAEAFHNQVRDAMRQAGVL